jgi:WhiB family redox-sensing transcriptional regulator
LFFPISAKGRAHADIARARTICGACPVRPRCLDFALSTRQSHGIWGGLTTEERSFVARQSRRTSGAA